MNDQQPIGLKRAAIGCKRFARQEVERNGIRRKRIQCQNVKLTFRYLGQRQPRITKRDSRVGRAFFKEGKYFLVARNLDHQGVNFEELPFLPRLAVASQCSGPKANDANAGIGAVHFRRFDEGFTNARILGIIADGARGFIQQLHAVHRRAMRQPPHATTFRGIDRVGSEIATHPRTIEAQLCIIISAVECQQSSHRQQERHAKASDHRAESNND